MHVTIQPLQRSETVLAALRHDGWAVEVVPGGALRACHHQVPDERAARRRLQGLGLLTSPAVRIDFGPHSPGR